MTTPKQEAVLAKQMGAAALRKQLYRIKMRENFADFIKDAWKIVEPPNTTLYWSWYLDLIAKDLEDVTAGRCRRLLINIPPRHSKSVIVSIMWQPWIWLTQPGKKMIFTSYDQGLLDGFSEKVQAIIDSDWYQDLIPTLFGPNKDQKWRLADDRKALRYFMTSERGERYSTTVRGPVTGSGADIVVIDDPMKASEAKFPVALEGVRDWFDNTLSSRLNDPQRGAFVCMMQRLHEGDLTGHLISEDEENKENKYWTSYKKLILPSEFDPDLKERFKVEGDIRTQPGELLFPDRFPIHVIEEIKAKMGPYEYSAQHRQDPTPTGAGVFDMSKIVFWYPADQAPPKPHKEPGDADPNPQMPLPASGWIQHAQSWDLTFKETLNSDFVCGQYWRRHRNAQMFLMEQVHAKMSFTATVEAIRAFTREHPRAIAKWIEDKANGPAVIDTLKKEIMGIVPINPEGGKEARANAVSAYVAAGNVVLPHPTIRPWVHGLLREMRGFPKAKHDDQVDALTQALIKLAGVSVDALRALAWGGSQPPRKRRSM